MTTTRILALCAIISSSVLSVQAHVDKWCIIGGSRGTGWQLAQTVASKPNSSCTIFVRDKAKAEKKFATAPHKPTIVQGDVTSDIASFKQAALGSRFIVFAQTFPYKVWEKSLRATIDNALAVSREVGATFIYLGRHYKYGSQHLISESSEPKPNSDQGRILNEIERQIEDAAQPGADGTSLVKTRIVCHSFPFGPNIGDGLLEKNFAGIAKNKSKSWFQSTQKFEWIGSSGDVALQMAYTPDLANFIYEYANDTRLAKASYHRINYAGLALNNINRLGYLYAKAAGDEQNYSLSLFSKSGLSVAAIVRPEAHRAKDVYYSFEKEILLDESMRRELFPSLKITPLSEAIQETFNWYNKNT